MPSGMGRTRFRFREAVRSCPGILKTSKAAKGENLVPAMTAILERGDVSRERFGPVGHRGAHGFQNRSTASSKANPPSPSCPPLKHEGPAPSPLVGDGAPAQVAGRSYCTLTSIALVLAEGLFGRCTWRMPSLKSEVTRAESTSSGSAKQRSKLP